MRLPGISPEARILGCVFMLLMLLVALLYWVDSRPLPKGKKRVRDGFQVHFIPSGKTVSPMFIPQYKIVDDTDDDIGTGR